MTIEERNTKLKHLITCMKCETSGKCCNDNCPTQYEAGNMGEIIENLEAISKILEQESVLNKIRAEIENHCGLVKENHCKYCSYCNSVMGVREILEILDKYNVESAVREWRVIKY